jgi:5-methylcytosine-specific restriction enzyme A
MPWASPTPCTMPGCGALVHGGRCDKHKPKDTRPTAARRGYGSRWQKARAAFLGINPLCTHCAEQGRTVEASVVDHIEPHRGDAKLFWDSHNWQSLCKRCHDGWKARIERGNAQRGKS